MSLKDKLGSKEYELKRFAVLMVLLLMLTGCSKGNLVVADSVPPVTAEVPTPSNPSPSPLPKSANLIAPSDMEGFETNASPAIAPASVEIGNFYPGATAEWQIIVHNGDGLKNKLLQITTEPSERVAAIPLKATLANNGLLDIIAITSTLDGEKLEAIAYDASTQLLTIKGFIPSAKRIVRITYKTISKFSVSYRQPSIFKEGYSSPPDGIESWVSFDTPALQLRPMENGVINVSLVIPPSTDVEAKKWLFWLGVIEEEVGASAKVVTQVELGQRILVTMR